MENARWRLRRALPPRGRRLRVRVLGLVPLAPSPEGQLAAGLQSPLGFGVSGQLVSDGSRFLASSARDCKSYARTSVWDRTTTIT